MRIRRLLVSCAMLLCVVVAIPSFARERNGSGQKEESSAEPTSRPSATTLPAGQILDQMLQNRPSLGKPLPPLDTPAESPDQKFVRKEGDVLSQRVGRLIRSEADAKQWNFHYEADGKTLQDPPMGVLPNSELARMEQTLAKSNREVIFRITGVVTLYKGHNYILIDRAETVRE